MRLFTHMLLVALWLANAPLYGQDDYYSADRKSHDPIVLKKKTTAAVPYSNAGFELHRNYPNPVTGYLELQYEVHQPGHYIIAVVGSKGLEIKKLLDKEMQPGNYKLHWPASPSAHGIYMYRVINGEPSRHRRLLMLKY